MDQSHQYTPPWIKKIVFEVSDGYFSQKRDVESPEDDVEAEVDEDDDVEVGPEDGSDEEVEQEGGHHAEQHRVQSPGEYLHNYHVGDSEPQLSIQYNANGIYQDLDQIFDIQWRARPLQYCSVWISTPLICSSPLDCYDKST